MDSKRALMIAKLDQRHKKFDATGNGHEIDQNEKNGGDSSTNGSENFQRRFYAERSSIETELDRLGDELPRTIDRNSSSKMEELIGRVSKLQLFLNESASMLPSYEIRKATTSLQDVQERMKRIRIDAQPQKRFAFTSIKPKSSTIPSTTTTNRGKSTAIIDGGDHKTNGTKTTDSDTIDGAAATHGDRVAADSTPTSAVVVQDRHDQSTPPIVVSQCDGKDVLILNCRSSTIRLTGAATTVHAKRLNDCVIIAHPVATSIFVEQCENCTFVVACQQLRMHSSVDCDLYVHVTTAAIIEDCRLLRFAPYLDIFDDEEERAMIELLDKAGLDSKQNSWNRVQDFNWLVIDQPSPNWRCLPREEWRRFQLSTTSN